MKKQKNKPKPKFVHIDALRPLMRPRPTEPSKQRWKPIKNAEGKTVFLQLADEGEAD